MKIASFSPFVFLATAVVASAQVAQPAGDLTPIPSDRSLPAVAIPDQYIVQVVPGVDPRAIAAAHGVAPRFVYQRAVQGFAGMVPPGRLAALRADPRVLHVTPDRAIAAIAKPSTGGNTTTAPSQLVPAGITRIGAAPNDNLGFTGQGVGVAVVDTGVDFNHPDLRVSSSSFTAYGTSAQDQNGHGTHVAGTIGAVNNERDVVGAAPGATIYAVRVLDASGSGSDSAVIAGLNWVRENDATAATVTAPIRVVNMSLGRRGTIDDNPTLRAAAESLVAAGIAVIVAAGNDASLEISQQVPACYPEVIAVASSTAVAGVNQSRYLNGQGISEDTASYFTTDGAGVVVSAPGEEREDVNKAGFIQSLGIISTKLGGGTTRMSGTSMAAPHVAGVAALAYEKVGASVDMPGKIKEALIKGADLGGASSAKDSLLPRDGVTRSYSFDGIREGVLQAKGTLDNIK